jgi:hyperosmotically inducible periplasmic protein
MNTTLRSTTLLIATAAALSLAACGRNDERSAGETLDASIAKTEQVAAEAKADIRQEAGEAKAAMEQQAAELKADASNAAERATSAMADTGAKAGAAVERMADAVSDKVSDAGITAGVNAELAKDSSLSALRIDVDTSNGHVSLRGTAPSKLARERATVLAKSVKGVTSVDNQLEVRG